MTELLTPDQFADRIALGDDIKDKARWVKRRCRNRQITHHRPSRDIFLIPASEVDRWLSSNLVEAELRPVDDSSAVEVEPVDVVAAVRSSRRRLAS